MKKFFRRLALAAAAIASLGSAHAGVITFDQGVNSTFAPFYPLMTHGDFVIQDGFDIGLFNTNAGAAAGDFVGTMVDGTDIANSCNGFGLICPTNNATNFLAALNDGLPDIQRDDGGLFRALKFDASFIAVNGDAIGTTALLIVVQGYNGANLAVQQQFSIPGPTNGAYRFNTFNLSTAFQNTPITELAFFGYYCGTSTTCVRTLDKAQFGLDNIAYAPEPGSMALVGMALVALTFSRRRGA